MRFSALPSAASRNLVSEGIELLNKISELAISALRQKEAATMRRERHERTR